MTNKDNRLNDPQQTVYLDMFPRDMSRPCASLWPNGLFFTPSIGFKPSDLRGNCVCAETCVEEGWCVKMPQHLEPAK